MTKKLEWLPVSPGGRDLKADTEFGEYVISFDSPQVGGTTYLYYPGSSPDDFDTFRSGAAAQYEAQADYDFLIWERNNA